jgi:predicted Zn-dependent protease
MRFHLIRLLASIATLTVVALLALPAQAAGLMRDADMEHALKQIAAPVLRAAGLSPARVKVLVVDDSSLNAFVVSNDAIFVHSGLINTLDSAAMLQGIIAHEAAHIVNGHIARRLGNIDNARTISGLGLALAAATAATGAVRLRALSLWGLLVRRRVLFAATPARKKPPPTSRACAS